MSDGQFSDYEEDISLKVKCVRVCKYLDISQFTSFFSPYYSTTTIKLMYQQNEI